MTASLGATAGSKSAGKSKKPASVGDQVVAPEVEDVAGGGLCAIRPSRAREGVAHPVLGIAKLRRAIRQSGLVLPVPDPLGQEEAGQRLEAHAAPRRGKHRVHVVAGGSRAPVRPQNCRSQRLPLSIEGQKGVLLTG